MTEHDGEDRELDELLRALDRPLPEISARDVIRRAGRGRVGPLRVAAGIAAALAIAGVAYGLPGSPVRNWVDGLIGQDGGADVESRQPAVAGPGGGLIFDPAEPLTLQIAPGSAGHVRIRPTEGGDLTVRMIAGEARFTSDPTRLYVRLRPADTLELRVPREARSVAATNGETLLFRKEGDVVTATVPPDTAGVYAFDLVPGTP
jgi:hypothetical protein